MMLKQLKKLYPSLITDLKHKKRKEYLWFQTPDQQVVGILKDELNQKETDLLDLLLSPYYGAHPPVTAREKQWFEGLIEGTNPIDYAPKEYRFVYFSLSEPLQNPEDFREAIYGLYQKPPAVIWSTQQQGIIIEEDRADEDQMSYYEMIEVFTSDFFIDVNFFIGPFLKDITKSHFYFEWMDEQFHKLQHFSIKQVITYVSAVPYLLATLKEKKDVQFLIEAILKETHKDEELLRTIQIFLEANSNASLAAKEIYMHRNSLQYRIDKFIEKSEVDVKQFEGAVAVYLVLLLKRQTELT